MKSKKIIVAALVAVAAIVLAGCSPRSSMATLSTDSDSETAEVFSLAKVLNLGTNYLTSLDYDNAILQYIDIIQHDPTNKEAYAGLYAAYAAQGKADEANKVFEQAQEVFDDEADFLPGFLDDAKLVFESGGGNVPFQMLSEHFWNDLNSVFAKDVGEAWIAADPQNADPYALLGAHYAALDDEIGIEKLLQNAETNGVDFNTIDTKIKTNSDGTCTLTVQINDFLKDESGQSASVSVKVDAKDNAKTVTQKVAEKAADSAASKVVEKSGLTGEAAGIANSMAQEALRKGLGSAGSGQGTESSGTVTAPTYDPSQDSGESDDFDWSQIQSEFDSDYLKYMNGEFDSTDDETKKYWDEKFKRYAGRISKENCKTHSVNAQWDMISGITDPEIEDMIIVVGAAQNTGKHSSWGKCKHTGYEVTAYSNRGSRVDVLAPGGEKTIDGIPDASIYSTVPYGNGYDGLVGTSMACPHVAGVAAMIFGIDPTFTAKEVKDIIISTATGSYGSVKEQYPLLNARLAVEKAIKLSNEKAKGQTGDDLPFEPSGEHQYRIFYDALTWEEAKAACEAKGGHLATITSEEEQQKLNLYNAGNHKLWIGGYKNTEGQWCWVTGEPWEYENWGDGEPNNSSNVVAGESCVAMWPEKWNDLANSNVYEQSGYICEWEASDVAEETQVEGYTGHLYEFYTLPESEWESGPITWQQAERRCEWKGGHLAVIESSTENFLLYSAMKAKGYENAYFGYSDKSSEGNWKWVNGTSTAYTNWHSGEPNNQDGIEHYAMFYENFQDGTWNDADGIIDAGCAYICEWDDPTDKISQGDSFTDQQLRIIAKDLGVPDDLNVEIRQSPKAYWESAGLWDIYVEITHNGKLVASGSFDVETGEMGRNIYIYTPV